MNISHAAGGRLAPACVIGEKPAVVFFDVRVAVTACGEHERDVAGQPRIRVIVAEFSSLPIQQSGKLEVQRVLARRQELMVVHTALPPVTRLFVQNLAAFV